MVELSDSNCSPFLQHPLDQELHNPAGAVEPQALPAADAAGAVVPLDQGLLRASRVVIAEQDMDRVVVHAADCQGPSGDQPRGRGRGRNPPPACLPLVSLCKPPRTGPGGDTLRQKLTPMTNARLRLLALLLSIGMLSCMSLVHHFSFMPGAKIGLSTAKPWPDAEIVWLKTEDNVTLQAVQFNAGESHNPGSHMAIIYFHGNAQDLAAWASRGAALRRRLDATVLVVDYRGYGQSGGKPTEAGLYLDAEAAFAHVNKTLGYPSQDIVLFGLSLGTAVAVNLAQRKELGGLILEGAVSSWGAVFDSFLDGISTFMSEGMFDSIGKINNVSCPLLMLHGTRDWVAPYEHAQALFNVFRGRQKTFVTIEGGHHVDLSRYPDYWPSIRTFLHRDAPPRY